MTGKVEKVAVRGRNGNVADEPEVWGMDMRPDRIHLGDCPSVPGEK